MSMHEMGSQRLSSIRLLVLSGQEHAASSGGKKM